MNDGTDSENGSIGTEARRDANPWNDQWVRPEGNINWGNQALQPANGGMFQASPQAVWREGERRQRTVRSFMMFLFLLLLLEDEPPPSVEEGRLRRRSVGPPQRPASLEPAVWQARQDQDERLQFTKHQRYQALIDQNDGQNVAEETSSWAASHVANAFLGVTQPPTSEKDDVIASQRVWHYPWNVSGLYFGQWEEAQGKPMQLDRTTKSNVPLDTDELVLPRSLEKSSFVKNPGALGVHFLPQPISVRDDHNFTSLQWDRSLVDGTTGRLVTPEEDIARQNPFWKRQHLRLVHQREDNKLPLTQPKGHVAMRLYSRSVPGLSGLSIVDGSVKITDNHSPHFPSSNDVVVRVRGVLLHAIGYLSLVSSTAPVTHSALILPKYFDARRLDESLGGMELARVRDQIWALHGPSLQNWVNQNRRRLQREEDGSVHDIWEENGEGDGSNLADLKATKNESLQSTAEIGWSDIIIPFPYALDDTEESLRQGRTGASRRFHSQERLLEANAAHCQFEMQFEVRSEEWTIGEWRNLMRRRLMEKERLKPGREMPPVGHSAGAAATAPYANRHWPVGQTRRRRTPPQDEALVMVMNGTIYSDTCDFLAKVNATAWRTNAAVATSRAMNYSFYMMLVCLAQIVVLLRQLVHSQSQSAATRVSLVGVGWQTVLDGLMCLGHIYLSLFLSSLFTPFASVAFFKLLIFCVIEMKYMAIIISARNSANGGQTTEVLRRQVAVLHLRYYVALFGSLILLFYATGTFSRRLYMLVLYSFWMPQIALNVVTQAKTALHRHYIYGMSLSRMVAPLYVFCVKNNFLHEVYPDVPYDPSLGPLLILWVAVQTSVLWAQGRYGARFMVPACFLPPKYDYGRPIPASMLPPGALDMHTDPMEDETRVVATSEATSSAIAKRSSPEILSNTSDHHTTSMTTRMRRMASTSPATSGGLTTTTTETPAPPRPRPTLDCCICYDGINVHDQTGYMLAPCDHLFHRSCLLQWMDVKMECPICRSDLPSL